MKAKMELDTVTVAQRKGTLEKELRRILATLIEKYQLEKIILFAPWQLAKYKNGAI